MTSLTVLRLIQTMQVSNEKTDVSNMFDVTTTHLSFDTEFHSASNLRCGFTLYTSASWRPASTVQLLNRPLPVSFKTPRPSLLLLVTTLHWNSVSDVITCVCVCVCVCVWVCVGVCGWVGVGVRVSVHA